jgi:hypothetical protein
MAISVQVVQVDEVDAKHDTSLSVTPDSGTFRSQNPVSVGIELTNEATIEREYQAGDGYRSVFSQFESVEQSPGLVLATRREALRHGIDLDELPGKCRMNNVPSSAGGYLNLRRVRAAPGQSQTIDLEVYGHPGNDVESLPEGEFRFVEEYRYKGVKNDGSANSFDWGFSLSVEG